MVAPGWVDRKFALALWARAGATILAAFGMSSLVSDCSFRLPMSPAADMSDDVTGSIAHSPLDNWLGVADRRFAMAAMAAALDPQGNGTPVEWNNPASQNKGVFVQQGKAHPVDDLVCRAFAATVMKKDATQRFSGNACLQKGGDWVISELMPAK